MDIEIINMFLLNVGTLTLANNFLVEFVKKAVTNKGTKFVALITAYVVTFLGLYFGLYNYDLVATIVLGFLVWMSSTLGFDSILQCRDSIVLLINTYLTKR